MSLFSLLIILAIIVTILIVVGGIIFMTKSFNLRSVYLYLVCFVTLIIFIMGTIFTVQKLVDVFVDGGYYYQTIEDYEMRYQKYNAEGRPTESSISKEELQQRYEAYLETEAERNRANSIRQLASSLSAMVVGGAFWAYHWKKIKEE